MLANQNHDRLPNQLLARIFLALFSRIPLPFQGGSRATSDWWLSHNCLLVPVFLCTTQRPTSIALIRKAAKTTCTRIQFALTLRVALLAFNSYQTLDLLFVNVYFCVTQNTNIKHKNKIAVKITIKQILIKSILNRGQQIESAKGHELCS